MSSVAENRGVQYSAEAAGAHGNLRCHVVRRRLGHDRRVQYSIVVCNETGADAHACAFIPGADGHRRTIVLTTIAPSSDFSTRVVLEFAESGLMPELNVALTSGDTEFRLVVPSLQSDLVLTDRAAADVVAVPVINALATAPFVRAISSPAPAFVTAVERSAATLSHLTPRPSRSRSSPAVAPAVLVFAVILAIAGFFVARPQIAEFAVAREALPGTTVPVAYRASGFGVAEYALVGPDGRTIAGAPLTLGSGNFSLTLPAGPAAPAYLVRLRVGNRLGSATAERYVTMLAAAAKPSPKPQPTPALAAPPQIRSLALDRAILASGETLTVYYDVLATRGSIALFDPASQITYGKSELTASGHTTFKAPHVDAARFLTVIVTAERGSATTKSRIGVSVTPPDATPPPAAAVGPDDGTTTGPWASTVISAPPTVHSHRPIRIDIGGAATGLRLVLVDGSGQELAHQDVPAGQRSIDFIAPDVRTATRFLIEATYPNGVGSETIVRGIVVMP